MNRTIVKSKAGAPSEKSDRWLALFTAMLGVLGMVSMYCWPWETIVPRADIPNVLLFITIYMLSGVVSILSTLRKKPDRR